MPSNHPSCASIDSLVTPFIDGELNPVDRQLVEQHLSRCGACRSRVTAEQSVHELMQERKTALCHGHAPAILRSRCAAAARFSTAGTKFPEIADTASAGHAKGDNAKPTNAKPTNAKPTNAKPTNSVRFGGRVWAWMAPLSAAASLVAIVGGAFLYQATAQSSHVLAAELAADHMKCFAMNAVLGTSQSAETVQSSMASGFGWNMRLPVGAEREGLELVGSRPCLYGEGKIAHIMYRHNGQPLSLFMLPRTVRPEQLVETLGHECAIWSSQDRTFVLVSRESRADVEKLAQYVHVSMR
jgi:anti-sigma factor RsiW